jgi:hypothetical protein
LAQTIRVCKLAVHGHPGEAELPWKLQNANKEEKRSNNTAEIMKEPFMLVVVGFFVYERDARQEKKKGEAGTRVGLKHI